MSLVVFPNGARVLGSSILDRRDDEPERAYGLYLDAQWLPTWPADVVAWHDFGLPEYPEVAAGRICDAFERASRGDLVEVGCLGGRGRTGTVLACMALLSGIPPNEAVGWVRDVYRAEAVETPEQEAWVLWFAAWAATHQSGPSPSTFKGHS